MPAYPLVAPFNGLNQQLFPYSVNQKVYETWFPLTYFGPLTSTDMTKPVYKHTIKSGEGLAFTVGKLNPLDYLNPVVDSAQKRGYAQTQTMDAFTVSTSRLSWPVNIRDQDLMAQGTPTEQLPSLVFSQLVEVQQKNFTDTMLRAATIGRYPVIAEVNGVMPHTSRAVAGNLDVAQPADGIWAYNNGATLRAELLHAMPQARHANHKLSIKHLRRLKMLAEVGGVNPANIVANIWNPLLGYEDPIRPSRVTLQNGQNSTEYYYFGAPAAINNLLNDAEFQTQMVSRIGIESQPQPISGADYVGKIYDINIYECPMLAAFSAGIDANNDGGVAWGLLIGAGAFTVGWYKYPYIVMDRDIIENSVLYCSHEQRGQDVLRYQAKSDVANLTVNGYNTVEQGIIHSFTRTA